MPSNKALMKERREFEEAKEQLIPMLAMSPMDSMIGSHSVRASYPKTLSQTASMDRRGPSPSVPQHRVVAERKWGLGLQLRSHPKEIMTQVLKTLGVLDVNWKKTSAYNVKCRWVARGSSLFENTHSNHGLTDSPMAGSMPRVSSGHWSADQRSMSIPAHAGETDNESSVETNFIKFEVQLFKMREEKYLLDLQRVEGPSFLFLDLCSNFLADLRVN